MSLKPAQDAIRAFEADPRPAWLWDPVRARILWANRPALDFWREESAADLGVRDFGSEDPAARLIAASRAALSEGKIVARRATILRDGEAIPAALQLAGVTLSSGREVVFVLAEPDTSRAPEVLRLEALVRLSPVPMTVYSAEGRARFQTEEADRLFGPASRGHLTRRIMNPERTRTLLASALSNGSAARVCVVMTEVGPARMRVAMRRFTDPKTGETSIIAVFEEAGAAPAAYAVGTDTLRTAETGAPAPVMTARTAGDAPDDAGPDAAEAEADGAGTEVLSRSTAAQAARSATRAEAPASPFGALTPGSGLPPLGSLLGEAAAPQEEAAAARPAPAAETGEAATQQAIMSALDAAGTGILTLDAAGDVVAISHGAAHLFRIDAEDAIGRRFASFLNEPSARRLDSFLRFGPVMAPTNFESGGEVQGVRLDGTTLPLSLVLRRIEGKGAERLVAVVRDMSEQKRLVDQLDQARVMGGGFQGNFLANVSHEIRTPLNAMIGFTDLMLKETFGPVGNAKYVEYLNDVHDSGLHVLSLVNDLLDLSKAQAGRLDLHLEPLDVGEVVKASERFVSPQAMAGKVALETRVVDGLPLIRADERSLRQIIINLASNAVKFTREGGRVSMWVRRAEGGGVEIVVRDTGIGMTPEELREALEPYGQVKSDVRRDQAGTGLGLPLARALAEAMKARFQIESEKGKGTAVHIIFGPECVAGV
ncbi:sensor histidine kinase [Futiania mangrovi]|uniref:histidine kinase n=1 Tax=Futiania mangrovi TaxID=2959716 RepID=A0A9J6PNK9_9PROT|nr:ATP-binding protein [Futiania mangrovii]MCP1337658.1 ATP-binding protein [Futiania mangrovii]